MSIKRKWSILLTTMLLITGTLQAKKLEDDQGKHAKYDSLQSVVQKIRELNKIYYRLDENQIESRAVYLAKSDSLTAKFQQLFIEIWNAYPEDERRYEYFLFNAHLNTSNNFYWRDRTNGAMKYSQSAKSIHQYTSEMDRLSYTRDSIQLELIANEYFNHFENAAKVNDKLKTYYQYKLQEYLKFCQNTTYRPSKDELLGNIKYYFLCAAKADSFGISAVREEFTPYLSGYYRVFTEQFITRLDEFGLSVDDAIQFIQTFSSEKNSILEGWQQYNLKLLNSFHKPLAFEGETTRGAYLNIQDYRGKVVLIDMWSIGCSACIAAFPKVNQLFNKYNKKGFTVIAACAADKKSIPKVESINRDAKVNWETVILSDDKTGKYFSAKYLRNFEFWGFPRYLLLDKEGKVISYSLFLDPDIEDKITSAL